MTLSKFIISYKIINLKFYFSVVKFYLDFVQTEGELQLDKVATEFCEKVNEQIRNIALAVEGASGNYNGLSSCIGSNS